MNDTEVRVELVVFEEAADDAVVIAIEFAGRSESRAKECESGGQQRATISWQQPLKR